MSFCVVPSVEQVTALGAKKVSKGRFLVHSLDTCASLLPKYPGTKDWETHDAETANHRFFLMMNKQGFNRGDV